jgi:hypothetical protein
MTQQTVNLAELAEIITAEVQNRLKTEVDSMLAEAQETLKQHANESKREKIVITGSEQYSIEADSDGLTFLKKDEPVMTIGKNGQMSTNTKSPRSVGKGSAHFKSGAPSEAIIPSSGTGSTRGIIVEGDGDDDKTYSFRAVSRMNRQGLNVTSEGSLLVGNMARNGKVTVYNNIEDQPGVFVETPSKDYSDSALKLQGSAALNNKWNHISAISDAGEDGQPTETFRVNGQGDVMSHGSVYSNRTGFAEMFEWADQNSKNEDRNGFTVALTQDGQIVPASDDDQVIGVVVPGAAMVGNAFWNDWHQKYKTQTSGATVHEQYELVEWLEMETTLIKSFYTDSLPANYALPDNACEIQTDENGDELLRPALSEDYSPLGYTGRNDRQEWATVCLLGTVPVYKGQNIGANWITVKSLSDELDLMIIK